MFGKIEHTERHHRGHLHKSVRKKELKIGPEKEVASVGYGKKTSF